MKYILVFALSFMFLLKIHAQSKMPDDSSSFKNYQYDIDKNNFQNYNPLPNINFKNKLKNNDCCVVHLTPPVLTYLGKAKHLNLYKASPDNIYVLMPDSSFILTMPVTRK